MQMENLFKALGERNRLRMVLLLERGPLNVSEIVQVLGLSQSNVSHHLRQLMDSGLLSRTGRGNWAFYSLRKELPLVKTVVEASFENRDSLQGFQDDLRRLARCLAGRKQQSREFFDSMEEGDLTRLCGASPESMSYLPFIERNLGKPARMLEVGSGSGRLIPFALTMADSVLGVDSSGRMLEYAWGNLSSMGMEDRVELRLGEAEHLPVENHAVEAVLMHMVLHHCGDPAQAVREAWRVLTPGGRLVIADLAEHQDTRFSQSQGDLWPGFTMEVLQGFLGEAGFMMEESEHYGDDNVLAVAGVKGEIS